MIFLLIPIQENELSELPPPYCVGTISSNGAYTSTDIEFWTKIIFKLAKTNDLKLIGVAADNYSKLYIIEENNG